MAPQVIGWTLPAREDLLKAVKDLGQESPAAAGRLLDRIEEAATSLRHFPDRGRPVPELGLPRRELIVADFRLVYWTRAGDIEVLRLIHGKRDFLRAWREVGERDR